MASKTERTVIHAAALMQGIVLVTLRSGPICAGSAVPEVPGRRR